MYPLHGVREVQVTNVSYHKSAFDLWTVVLFVMVGSEYINTSFNRVMKDYPS